MISKPLHALSLIEEGIRCPGQRFTTACDTGSMESRLRKAERDRGRSELPAWHNTDKNSNISAVNIKLTHSDSECEYV